MMKKGTIALDIDGTITGTDRMIPDDVALYLTSLYEMGWQFVLVTGRIFSYAMNALAKLDFPFLLAVQNGADLIEMPGRKKIKQWYFESGVIEEVERLYEHEEEDFLVYAGFEKGDFCYYRPHRYTPLMREYLKRLKALCAEPWQEVPSFDLAKQKKFPMIKCFGSQEKCQEIEEKLSTFSGVKTSVIKDPISQSLHLVLITHQEANKGQALNDLVKTYHLPRPIITAGDDNNDIPLLEAGDVRIAMKEAPNALKRLADIEAPSASQSGIIQGLQKAIDTCKL